MYCEQCSSFSSFVSVDLEAGIASHRDLERRRNLLVPTYSKHNINIPVRQCGLQAILPSDSRQHSTSDKEMNILRHAMSFCAVTYTSYQVFTRWTYGELSIHMPLSGNFAVTLTFDLDLHLLTLKCTHFNYVPNCTQVVNLAKFSQAVCKICRPKRQAGETTNPGDQQPENCRATELN